MTLHQNEIAVDEALVGALLAAQRPEWAQLPLAPAGSGTDNTLYRLGDDLLVRLPRTPGNGRSVGKERRWLPRLAPRLTRAVPEPVHAGTPTDAFPVAWSDYRWIDGEEAGPDTVSDWAAFGADLAATVRELHAVDLMGATRGDDLSWYRGGSLRPCDEPVSASFADCRAAEGAEFDVDTLERLWRAGLALPDPAAPHVWLHGDLKPTNHLVRDGGLHAVIDFGALSVGFPDAEHATVWDLPPEARHAYWNALGLDDATWAAATCLPDSAGGRRSDRSGCCSGPRRREPRAGRLVGKARKNLGR
ncbi:aminoglycoside phosphotransferase family protein [Streptomyces sp. WMMC897]|uniref:aminoglycoside phosphotransferase family protein n=1 Tax=Streptomyces sp. WMMC897 TaxID=3014782 RepID=UPI0022B60329|nr:aminoglycoside phosphotransferase family protein [Streptomyces sp. WMMC897]MCZ7417317.1 aminoglycoside phosphotransferase family protein [Streptomyces sp. WMMC897]